MDINKTCDKSMTREEIEQREMARREAEVKCRAEEMAKELANEIPPYAMDCRGTGRNVGALSGIKSDPLTSLLRLHQEEKKQLLDEISQPKLVIQVMARYFN